MNTSLSERRFFFDSYCKSASEQGAKLSPGESRFSCPCCGYPTLGERGHYDICKLCDWEDDGQDDPDADIVLAGPNHHCSLADARLNFEKYLVMYEPEKDRRIGGPDSEKARHLKLNLITAFDKMMEASSAEELNNLWQEVKRMDKALRKDLSNRIKEYEAKIMARRQIKKS